MRSEIYEKINQERIRQNELHPIFPEGEALRIAILLEEVGEVAKAINEGDTEHMKKELIEVASVCVRWLETYAQ